MPRRIPSGANDPLLSFERQLGEVERSQNTLTFAVEAIRKEIVSLQGRSGHTEEELKPLRETVRNLEESGRGFDRAIQTLNQQVHDLSTWQRSIDGRNDRADGKMSGLIAVAGIASAALGWVLNHFFPAK